VLIFVSSTFTGLRVFVTSEAQNNLQVRQVCQFFCVNGQVLFLGMGCRGRGQFPFLGPAL